MNWHPLLLEGAFLWHTTGMEKTLTLNSEELEILSEIFGSLAERYLLRLRRSAIIETNS